MGVCVTSDLWWCLWVGFLALSMCCDVDILIVSGSYLAPPDCKLQGGDWVGLSRERLDVVVSGL